MEFELGDLAKDTVTGFEGIVVARTEWLNGCWRILLQSQKLSKEGNPTDPQQFDDQQLVLIKRGALTQQTKKAVGKKETGGPRPTMKARSMPV